MKITIKVEEQGREAGGRLPKCENTKFMERMEGNSRLGGLERIQFVEKKRR